MHSNSDESRLSRIETHWSLVRQAHEQEDSARVVDAKQLLLLRYAPAIRRYLGAALRDNDAADEVFQEFAVKFSRGDFRTAAPDQGRFRQFVKTVLYRLIMDHHRQRRKRQPQSGSDAMDSAVSDQASPEAAFAEADEAMLLAWRDELLNVVWEKLREYSAKNKATYYSILRLRVENPQWTSDELAARANEAEGVEVNAGSVRVTLHRARERFAALLLDALADSMDSDNVDLLEAEVIELRLLDYCRDALAKRRERDQGA